jgi:mandelamide amidase
VLLDGIVAGGAMSLSAISLKGLRLGVPRGYFWENLDAEAETILADTLAQLAGAGVVLVEGDMDDVAARDAAAGFPVALYEFVTDFNRYLAGHATGLDFAGVAAQVKSPAVKCGRPAGRRRSARAGLSRGADQTPAGAAGCLSPLLQEQGVAAMVFPTTPLAAAKIGEDETVVLNGRPAPTLPTYIRNLGPGSAAGLPGLSVPAGMTRAGLPVGIANDGREGGDQELLTIGLALESLLPRLPAPDL